MNIVKKAIEWDFDSSQMTSVSTPLRKKEQIDVDSPEVQFSAKAMHQLQLTVQYCSKEVGWWGYVEKYNNGYIDIYLVEEIYVPDQTVSHTETDIDANSMASLAEQLMKEGKDPSKLIYWGHSHVDMGVSPSGQDEAQASEYLNDMPVLIRGIHNKKGQSKIDIYDRENGVVHQCVSSFVFGMTVEEEESWVEMLDRNVKSCKTTDFSFFRNSAYSVPDTTQKMITDKGIEVGVKHVTGYDYSLSAYVFGKNGLVYDKNLTTDLSDALDKEIDSGDKYNGFFL